MSKDLPPRPDLQWKLLEEKVARAAREHPEKYQLLLENPSPDPAYASQVARVKRFLECYTADRTFRGAMDTPEQAAQLEAYQIDIDPEEIRFLWDHDFHMEKRHSKDWCAPLSVQRYRLWITEKILHRERLRVADINPTDERHARWRQRQMNRMLGHLGRGAYERIINAPFSIELSDGCSVGCWFCGVSAEKRKEDWPCTPENQAMWREMMDQLHELMGPTAQFGFCYWATDPLDNPDYEAFMRDYADRLGGWPQTTTAQAHKHVERVRKLLVESRQRGCLINRFSVLSLGIFKKLLQAFTAEELLYTELITQNMEATSMQSNSGRARGSERLKVKASQTEAAGEDWEEKPGTIACVSGFLINMPRKTVKLITPVPCNDRWPNGYWVFEEGTFQDAASFRALMDGMMERHMPMSARLQRPACFRRDLKFTETSDGFELHSFGLTKTWFGGEITTTMGRLIAAGDRTVQEVALETEKSTGQPLEKTMNFLNQLFDEGLLDEEPARSPWQPAAAETGSPALAASNL